MRSNEVEVTRPRLRDLEEIYEIEKMSFDDPFPKLLILSHIILHSDTSFVVKIGGKVVGYLFAAIQRAEGGKVLHILNLAVHPSYRRMGYASLLIKKAEELARSLGLDGIILEVSVKNKPAISLYKKMGFVAVDVLEGYYPSGEDAYFMVKNIREFEKA